MSAVSHVLTNAGMPARSSTRCSVALAWKAPRSVIRRPRRPQRQLSPCGVQVVFPPSCTNSIGNFVAGRSQNIALLLSSRDSGVAETTDKPGFTPSLCGKEVRGRVVQGESTTAPASRTNTAEDSESMWNKVASSQQLCFNQGSFRSRQDYSGAHFDPRKPSYDSLSELEAFRVKQIVQAHS